MPTRNQMRRAKTSYEFIKEHEKEFAVKRMCKALGVNRSAYYFWLANPQSDHAKEDERLLRLIRASYRASHGVYGAPRILLDLREMGESCSEHRVARLMREHNIRASHGYRVPRFIVAKTSELIPNLLQREFDVAQPNKVWVSDITYIRTWEGWLYLAVVMDLYSRKIVGWATRPTLAREVVLDAILMAVRTRRPRKTLMHSDQGCQYGSDAWRRFCRGHHLEPSMSRRGNCWDNAVAESFFSSLKKERIKKTIYKSRDLATADVADYIESFYNPIRRHSHLSGVSPDVFEANRKRRK
jgi:putative transposase